MLHPKSERQKESRKQKDIADRAITNAMVNNDFGIETRSRYLSDGMDYYHKKNNYYPQSIYWDRKDKYDYE